MTTFTQEEIHQIEVIKMHMHERASEKGVVSTEITDKMALQYALGITEMFIKEAMPKLEKTKKQKLNEFIARKKAGK